MPDIGSAKIIAVLVYFHGHECFYKIYSKIIGKKLMRADNSRVQYANFLDIVILYAHI